MKTIPKGETLAVVGMKELHGANWNATVEEITRQFDSNGARCIELDLSEATFIDPHGLGALIVLNRTAQRRNGRLRLVNPSWMARQILEMTQMHRLIPIENDNLEDPVPISVQPSRNW